MDLHRTPCGAKNLLLQHWIVKFAIVKLPYFETFRRQISGELVSDGLGRVQFGAHENHPSSIWGPGEKASPGCNMSGTSWRMQAMHDSLVRTSFDNAKWCDSLNRKDLLDQVSLHFETRTSHNVSMFHHTWSIHKWKDKFWQSKEFSFCSNNEIHPNKTQLSFLNW